MTPSIPQDVFVRYDYHNKPRSTTAVIISKHTHNVLAVGVAKFNPRDGVPNVRLGETIALGRALAKLDNPRKHRAMLPAFAGLYFHEDYPERAVADINTMSTVELSQAMLRDLG